MRHPPYHLRMNKAVDRFLLVDLLRVLNRKHDMSKYTYYGLGGPFLEDCRLINQYFPDTKIISIEEDDDIYKRQKFHRFSKNLKLKRIKFKDFIIGFSGKGRDIFWLDYTGLEYANLEEFMNVLSRVGEYSVVRITLRANLLKGVLKKDYIRKKYMADFNDKFGILLPGGSADESCFLLNDSFVRLVQDMVKVQAELALPVAAQGNVFQILNSSYYNDGTTMLSVSGIVCPIKDIEDLKKLFAKWSFANLEWGDPHFIDLPFLSIKERLKLEQHLPLIEDSGTKLSKVLGYKLETIESDHLRKLLHYKNFHRYYPSFAKIVV